MPITLPALLSRLPPHARQDLEDDPPTLTYIETVLAGKSNEEARDAVEPIVGLSKKQLHRLFSDLSLESNSSSSALPDASGGIGRVGGGVNGSPIPASLFKTHALGAPSPDTSGASTPRRRAKHRDHAASPLPVAASLSLDDLGVSAYSQQSRFHTTTLQTLSTEVDLHGVNVTIGASGGATSGTTAFSSGSRTGSKGSSKSGTGAAATQDADLLVDARLRLKAGVHYGLVGRNGTGKSTLLKAIGERRLIGFPENVRVLYIAQLDIDEEVGDESVRGTKTSSGEDGKDNPTKESQNQRSVLDTVLAADTERQKRLQDVARIERAMAEGTEAGMGGANTAETEPDTQAIKRNTPSLRAAIEAYISRIATERIELAQRTATLRSGTRGKKARAVALAAEKNMWEDIRRELYGIRVQDTQATTSGASDEEESREDSPAAELDRPCDTPYQRSHPAKADSAEANSDSTILPRSDAEVASHILAVLFDELDKMDAHSAEARARAILASLNVDEAMQDGPVSALSGGWRMRVAIAKALFVEPDILLLDECTNHLDLAAIAWLEGYIRDLSDITVVCVSHDRDFLNNISEEIIKLKDQKLTYHPGNYDEYEQTQDELRRKKERQHAALEKRREHVQASIARFKQQARASGDDKLLSQAASRAKKLDRMAGTDKTEDGKRFKVSYWAGYHATLRPEIDLIQAEKEVDLRIPQPEVLGSTTPLVTLNNVSFTYPGKKHRVRSVSLSLMPGDHIGIVGLNGSGKSTLVELLYGTLTPTHGTVNRHPKLRIGYYAQHFVDQLGSLTASGMDILQARAEEMLAETRLLDPSAVAPKPADLRRYLGSMDITGPLATRPVHLLSGGQRARVALALMLYDRPHMLLLDEVTNHLDMYTVQGLVAALNEYDGTLVVVTHDRHFVRETAETVYAVQDGRVKRLEEGVDEYVAQFA